MSPLRFNDVICIATSRKSRTEPDDTGCHVALRAQIPFGQDRIDDDSRLKIGNGLSFRIDHDGNPVFFPGLLHVLIGMAADSRHIFHRAASVIHGLGQSHLTADGRGSGRFQRQYGKSGPPYGLYDAGRQVATTADDNAIMLFHDLTPLIWQFHWG